MKRNDNVDRRAKRLHDAYQQEIDGVLPSEGLQPKYVEKLVENGKGLEEKKPKRHFSFYRVTAIAASLALVISVGAVALQSVGRQDGRSIADELSVEQADQAKSAKTADYGTIAQQYAVAKDDYTPLAEYLSAAKEQYSQSTGDDSEGFLREIWNSTVVFSAENPGDDLNAASSEDIAAEASSDYSDTNNQVENVQEGDMIKTDGRYIYTLTGLGNLVCTHIEADGSLTKTDSLSVAGLSVVREHENASSREMYLCGDQLALVLSFSDGMNDQETTAVVLIRAADGKLSEFGSYRQEGSYQSGRLTDGALYIVTSDYKSSISAYDQDTPESYVPLIWKNEKEELVSTEEICIGCESVSSVNYTNITGYRFGSPAEQVQTLSILGNADTQIYCTETTLYLFAARYRWNESVGDASVSASLEDISTEINSFSLDGGKIAAKAKGSVAGQMLNQFSADEKDGYLRVATTDTNASRIVTLDGNLKVVSQLKDIAPGEDIYACRFMGDTAYLVTFHHTDPLFVIDLSDAAAPKIVGELELPGFSNYLYPAGENYLVGVGKNTDENGFTDGLRINLFDVSDPENPKLADYKTLSGDSASLAAVTHKAFYYDEKNNRFGVSIYRYLDGREVFNGFVLFDLENGKLDIAKELDLKAENGDVDWSASSYVGYLYNGYCVQRGIYVDDTLYLLTKQQLYAYQRDTLVYLNCFDLE